MHSCTGRDGPSPAQGPQVMQMILASASPRRQHLLSAMNLAFEVVVTDVDEKVRLNEDPSALVRRLSRDKARAALIMLSREQPRTTGKETTNLCIIAADTIVVAPDDRTVLGKPTSSAHAREMLAWLRNKKHRVYSGVTLLDAQRDRQCTLVAYTDVHMRPYSDEELLRYVASGDPMDKAGAYAIQHDGFSPIDHLDNCYANVMGLPMCHLYGALQDWCAKSAPPPALPPVRHPLTCCPFALEHDGCPWARDILSLSGCPDQVGGEALQATSICGMRTHAQDVPGRGQDIPH